MVSLGADEAPPARSREAVGAEQLARVDDAALRARSGDVRGALTALLPMAGLRRRGLPPAGRAWVSAALMDCRLVCGDLAEAVVLGEEVVPFTTRARTSSAPLAAALAHATRAALATATGDPGAAVDHAEAVGAALAHAATRGEHLEGAATVVAGWRTTAALGMLRTGRAREAAALAAEEMGRVEGGSAYDVALALRTLAATDVGFERIAILHRAAAAASEAGSVRLRAQIDTDLAGLLVLDPAPSARTEALVLLRSAEAYAGHQELWPLHGRVRRLLVHLGEQPRRVRDEALEALSASERRIATLAADGLSNRDIATRIEISLKGVEWHLSKIYRKLDIGSRAELAVALGVV